MNLLLLLHANSNKKKAYQQLRLSRQNRQHGKLVISNSILKNKKQLKLNR